MSKNRHTTSDIFVNKLSERMGKIMIREVLCELWLLSGGSKSRFAYGLGQARGREILSSLGGGLYIVGNQDGDQEKSYWQMISLLIHRHSPSGAIIAHEKSLEYYLRDFAIPETLVLYSRDCEKRFTFGEYKVHFRILKTGEKTGTKNMYRILADTSTEGCIEGVRFRFLSPEASLLDVASLRIHESGIAEDIILKFLKKYSNTLSREVLGELVSYRYIRAINRIRSLAKTHGFDEVYHMCLDIIKKEGGGCYLHL